MRRVGRRPHRDRGARLSWPGPERLSALGRAIVLHRVIDSGASVGIPLNVTADSEQKAVSSPQ
jgi:hypothetical protein